METTDLVERVANDLWSTLYSGNNTQHDVEKAVAAALEAAGVPALQARVEKLEERIRILVWNREKGEGNSDDGAMQAVEEELAALAENYCGIVEVNEEDFKAEGESR